jgi:hypothetical protein
VPIVLKFRNLNLLEGQAVAQLFVALRYESEGREFHS